MPGLTAKTRSEQKLLWARNQVNPEKEKRERRQEKCIIGLTWGQLGCPSMAPAPPAICQTAETHTTIGCRSSKSQDSEKLEVEGKSELWAHQDQLGCPAMAPITATSFSHSWNSWGPTTQRRTLPWPARRKSSGHDLLLEIRSPVFENCSSTNSSQCRPLY